MKTSISLLINLSIISVSAISAENIEMDENQLLVASCRAMTAPEPEQVNAKAGVYFIQGFVSAAQTIDPPVIKNKNQKEHKFYEFMSRPHRNWKQVPYTRFFPFCVPSDESNARVIELVSKQMPAQIDTIKNLKKIVFETLKAGYPCGKTNQS